MFETLKCMKRFVTKEMREATPEELASAYKITKQDTIIAAMYEKLFAMALEIRNKYPIVTDDQTVATAILETIAVVLEEYDPSKSTKVSTTFYTYFSRRMYGESKPYTRKKRVCSEPQVSFDDCAFKENSSGKSISYADIIPCDKSSDDLEQVLLNIEVDNLNLTELQKEIIRLMYEGYSAKQISNIIPNMTLQSVFKNIKLIRNCFSTVGLY